MRGFTNAVLFSKRGGQQQLAALGSKAIEILSVLWVAAPNRNPWIDGGFAVFSSKPECSAFSLEEVATDTGYKLSRFHGISVVGKSYELPRGEQKDGKRWARKTPDMPALCHGKKPFFVSLDQVGYDNRTFFKQGIVLTAELVSSGYYGSIRCYSDCDRYHDMYDNPERCAVSVSEDGLLAIRIHWGDETLVGSLLDFCRAEKFTEEEGLEDYEKPRKTA